MPRGAAPAALAPVKGFRKREIARGAKHWLAPGAAVVTDGLGCWSALDEIACSHQAIRTGSGRQAARKWDVTGFFQCFFPMVTVFFGQVLECLQQQFLFALEVQVNDTQT